MQLVPTLHIWAWHRFGKVISAPIGIPYSLNYAKCGSTYSLVGYLHVKITKTKWSLQHVKEKIGNHIKP
jgi:hypothetical protein